MLVGIAALTIFGLIVATVAFSGDGAAPANQQRIRDHFMARSHEVLRVERAGVDFHDWGLRRNLPIYKYRVVMKGIDGRELTRIVGIDAGFWDSGEMYAYDASGFRHPMF